MQSTIKFTKDDLKEIPLYNDLISTFSDDDINNYCDIKNLYMYMILEGKISAKILCDYIKFINFTSLPLSCYEKIIKYINVDNIKEISEVFINDDIRDNIFPLLSFNIISEILDNELIKPNLIELINKYNSKFESKFTYLNKYYASTIEYLNNYSEYFNFLNKYILYHNLDTKSKIYLNHFFSCAVFYDNFNIVENLINLIDIYHNKNFALRKSVNDWNGFKNRSTNILKYLLKYNNINKINNIDYNLYKKINISYENEKGLNGVIEFIGHVDNYDINITWFTDDNTFYYIII